MQNMTPRQAIAYLDRATQPGIAPTLKRADYVLIETALAVIEGMVIAAEKAAAPAKPETEPKP